MLRNFLIKKNYDKKIYMIVTYYPHSKSTHNKKFMELEFFENSMYVFIIAKVQESFTTCKWCVIHMTYKKAL